MYVSGNNIIYFVNFGVEHIPKTNKNIIRNKKFTTNICRIQAYDLVMSGHFCIGIIDFMLKGKNLLDYINLYSPNDYGKNDEIILKLFKLLSRLKNYSFICGKCRKLETPKISLSSFYYLQ